MPEAVLHIERERRLNEFYDYMGMIIPFSLFLLALLGCKEFRIVENSDAASPKTRIIFSKEGEKYPLSMRGQSFPCEVCTDGELMVQRPSFYADIDRSDIESDSVKVFLPDVVLGMFWLEVYMHSSLDDIYAEHIRKMRKSESDSSYFIGILELKISLDSTGRVGHVLVKKSTTGNRPFDEAVVHYISKMKISGVLEPCFLIVKFRFQRSGFSGRDIEIVDERLLHFPNDLPIGRRPIDSNMAM